MELYQKELLIKKEKKEIQDNKKLLRKRVMARYFIFLFCIHLISLLEGKMPQTPLVDKMFNLQMDSRKKFKRKEKLQFDDEVDEAATNLALQ